MKEYLKILSRVYWDGMPKHPSRAESGPTVNSTFGLPNQHFSFDMERGFPLLTTRRLPWKNIVGELRSFLLGHSLVCDFQNLGCHFWDPWARQDGSLGPIYGVQWNGHGQLEHVLACLRDRPEDRRMVVSAWRPDEHGDMVLPPCHVMWILSVYNRKLNLAWMQRSADFPIGVPCNIASYALLLTILAKWGHLEVGNLSCLFCDAHIYDNQMEGVREQLKRTPKELPSIDVEFTNEADFNSWQVHLSDYEPLPNIDFGDLEI